jgi:hypothetical protein
LERREGVARPEFQASGGVSFQITNGNVRQACTLQTKFSTQAEARKHFLMSWPIIERMARDAILAGKLENGQITLVMV